VLRPTGFEYLSPAQAPSLPDWWLRQQKMIHKEFRRGFDSLVILVSWMLCGENETTRSSTSQGCRPQEFPRKVAFGSLLAS
jgi:hypothetical protein